MKYLNKSLAVILPVLVGLLFISIVYFIGGNIEAENQEAGLTESQASGIRRIMLPYPGEVFTAFKEESAIILNGARSTLTAAVLGFVSAVIGGYFIALIMSPSRYLKQSIYPWVMVLQMTPIVILAPILSVWLKEPPMGPIIMVTFLIGFFPVLANSMMGLTSVDKNLVDLFEVCSATRMQELIHLRIPNSVPYLLTGMKIAGTLAPIGAITGDIFVGSADADPGLGYLTILFKQSAKTPALFATAGTACIMGFLFVGVVNFIHWYLLKNWHDSMVNKNK